MNETVAALLLEDWRNEIIQEIHSINDILPNVSDGDEVDVGEKAIVIREWIQSVLRRVIHYKAQHRRLLNEVVTPTLQYVLPDDIVMNNVLPFVKLPSYTFDGEVDEGLE